MTLVHGGHSVIYVELSPHIGTAAKLLKMPQPAALGNSNAQIHDLSQEVVTQMLMQHSTGLKILSLSSWAQEVGYQISTEFCTILFRELKALANYLVLDFPLEPSFSSMFFLNQCQIIDLVIETDSICLALTKKQIEFLKSQSSAPMLVTPVNRSGIPPADGLHGIQEQVGLEVPVLIPPASELCHTAGIKGLPIVCFNPESVLAMQFAQLSEQLLGYFSEDGSEDNRDRRSRDRRKGNRRNRGAW